MKTLLGLLSLFAIGTGAIAEPSHQTVVVQGCECDRIRYCVYGTEHRVAQLTIERRLRNGAKRACRPVEQTERPRLWWPFS